LKLTLFIDLVLSGDDNSNNIFLLYQDKVLPTDKQGFLGNFRW